MKYLMFIFILWGSAFYAQADCGSRRIKHFCEAPGSPCVWSHNHCSLRDLRPDGDTGDNPSVLKNFGWRALNEHKWPEDS